MEMRIDIEHVRKIQEERMKINSVPIEQIEWYEDGKKVEIDPKVIEDFVYTGLNNTDFIISEMYKEKRHAQIIPDTEYKELFEDQRIVGQAGCSMGELGSGATGLGPQPYLVDAEEFIKRIKSLRLKGMTKEQCKDYVLEELKKKIGSGGMSKTWYEWESLIEVGFGNLITDCANPVVRNVIEIMKHNKSL
jgi:hypothetical protein